MSTDESLAQLGQTGQSTTIPRSEHPNPQYYRPNFVSLNGTWKFEFDDENIGIQEHWYNHAPFSREILVPFAYQSELSGIGDPRFHDVVWYQRQFSVETDQADTRVLLHFGAVDYKAQVWINGQFAGQHEGGHTPFTVDATDLVSAGANLLLSLIHI